MKAGILIITTGPVPVLLDLRILKLAISYCIVFIFKYTYLIMTETHCCMLKRGGSQYHVIT